MHLLGIDPGFDTGGLALIDTADGHVLAAMSAAGVLEVPPTKVRGVTDGDADYAAVIARAGCQARRICDAVLTLDAEYGVHEIVIESFIDLPSKARKEKAGLMRQRYKTPLVMGALDVMLAEAGFDVMDGRVVYQNPVAIHQMKTELGRLQDRHCDSEAVVPGGGKLTNNHMRTAWVHAETRSLRLT